MNRRLTALFAALEAALVVAIGIGISLAPLTVLWGAYYGFGIDWTVFWRASVDIWLLGHGVDVIVTLDPGLAAGLGVAGADTAFPLTIAVLGFALITTLLGVRAGRRVGETRFRNLGAIVAIGTFAALSLGATVSALHAAVRASIVQGAILPTLVFTIGLAIGLLRTRRAAGDDAGSSLRDWINDWPPAVRAALRQAVVGGAAAASGILVVAAVVVAASLIANYAQIISLYERLHGGALGGLVLTLGQLALLPNLIIWAVAWLIGPGFAIGTGSTIGPLATQVGPLPTLPILGALPSGDFTLGFLGLLVPVVVAFLLAAVFRPGLVRELGDAPRALWFIVAGLGMGVTAGVLIGLLVWFSAGAAGPGRLVDVGPNPILVGLFAALEVGLAATVGFFAARRVAQKNAGVSGR
jgi:Family of unknown function (DUF6350)